jgi:hypothetical protein
MIAAVLTHAMISVPTTASPSPTRSIVGASRRLVGAVEVQAAVVRTAGS